MQILAKYDRSIKSEANLMYKNKQVKYEKKNKAFKCKRLQVEKHSD